MSSKLKPKVIGLTGNIACGKSTVARLLSALGVAVVDADELAREVTAKGSPALKKLRKEFGDGVFDAAGALDRAKLREAVFADPAKRLALESILHPEIARRSRVKFEELGRAGHEVVVYEAALIVEAGRERELDGLLVVACPKEAQRARLKGRDSNLPAETAERMIGSQLPQETKRAAATWVIENDGSLEELKAKVAQWARAAGVIR
jgi:dephospho-CoA kinase